MSEKKYEYLISMTTGSDGGDLLLGKSMNCSLRRPAHPFLDCSRLELKKYAWATNPSRTSVGVFHISTIVK